MSDLATLETGARIVAILGRSAATMRKFNANFVTHKIAFVVFSEALFSSFSGIEFLGGRKMVARDPHVYLRQSHNHVYDEC